MTADNINIEEVIKRVKDLVAREINLSPAIKGRSTTASPISGATTAISGLCVTCDGFLNQD